MWPYVQSPDSVFSITAPAAYGGLFLAVTLLPLSLHSHSHCSCNCSGFLKVPGEIMEEPDLWTGHSGCLQFLSCQVQLSAFCGFPLFSSRFCHEWCIYSVQSKVPLRGSGHSQTEMVDIMVECFRPSSPGCITDATDVVCLHVVCLYCTASCYTGRPHPLKKPIVLYLVHSYLSTDFIGEQWNILHGCKWSIFSWSFLKIELCFRSKCLQLTYVIENSWAKDLDLETSWKPCLSLKEKK